MKLITVLAVISLAFCAFFFCRELIQSSNALISADGLPLEVRPVLTNTTIAKTLANYQFNESDRKELEDLAIVTLIKIAAWSVSDPTPCRDGLINSLPENIKNKAGSVVKGKLTTHENEMELDIPELHYCLFFVKVENKKFYFLKDYSYCEETFLHHKRQYPSVFPPTDNRQSTKPPLNTTDQRDQSKLASISNQVTLFIKIPEIVNPIGYLNSISSSANIQSEVSERIADSIASSHTCEDSKSGSLTVWIPQPIFFNDVFFVYVHENKGEDFIAVIRTILPETSDGKLDYAIDRVIFRKDEINFFQEKITRMSPKRLTRSCSSSK